MTSVQGSLRLDFGDWGSAGRIAILIDPLLWISTEPGYECMAAIPAGYMSDGASAPRFLWWLLPPWGERGTQAAIVHDYLLDRLQGFEFGGPIAGAMNRKGCDKQFLLALLCLGIPKWKAYTVWLGVRLHSIRLRIIGGQDQPLVTG